MTTISHEPRTLGRPWWLPARDMWTSQAITVIWLAVLFDSLFGPNIYSHDVSGTDTTVPSGVVIAFFAPIATIGVAKYGFSRKTEDS